MSSWQTAYTTKPQAINSQPREARDIPDVDDDVDVADLGVVVVLEKLKEAEAFLFEDPILVASTTLVGWVLVEKLLWVGGGMDG
jgi:hypothetical protein